MPTALAVASAVIGIGGIAESRSARQGAAAGQEAAAIGGAEFLEEQGRLGQEAIAASAQEAQARLQGVPEQAIAQIQPFQQAGTQAFRSAQQRILGGETGGGISEAVANAARGVNIPGQQFSPVVQREMARQGGLLGQAIAPQVSQQLLGLGRVGLGAAGDVAGITTRGAQRVGDIQAQSGAQQASALVGQTPQIAQQLQIGGEARLLGQLSGQQADVQTIEQLARLGGRLS